MSTLESVHNYYERRVFDHINENYLQSGLNEEQLADLACMALNRIPPRYIRYDIDMSFYMSGQEHIEVDDTVAKAVKKAFKKIRKLDEV
ncbi:MAG: late competence development ComFB family protein [Hydrogenovibrio sp.]|uniref:late competence development ComFB family protein n=1 Tax=Hydrogenovibrio TaxID=28884 RepID=UPI000368FEB7|nr:MULTISPECIES: late competence development ComFB family protein [Hydrogenovibrio]MDR9498140.1 late competence development ComFB family protein [Hydrogenovibrio sp.]